MTAPRLSLDDARSFEVPCRWTPTGGETSDGVLWVTLVDGEWLVSLHVDAWAPLYLVARVFHEPWGLWGNGSVMRDRQSFPSAQEALVAAFATDQIEPRGDQG